MKYNLFKVLTFLCIVLSIENSFGQSTFKGGFHAGVAGTQVSGDGYGGFNKAGLVLGAFVKTPVSNSIDAQFEIEYHQKGSRKNPDSGAVVVDLLILRLDYVQVPVLLKYNRKSFYLEAGLYAGLLVNFYLEDETGERTTQFQENQQLEDVKNTEFGYLIGLGYSFYDNFSFNTRFSQTLGNVKRYDSQAYRWLDSGWRNISVSFTIRYTFGENG